MAFLKKYDLLAKEIGEFEISDEVLKVKCNRRVIEGYCRAIRDNNRQWSANTKTRSEVKATGKKSQRQKGLGRARHGALTAPQFRGGGVVFGPKPKFDQHVRINKKERRLAIKSLLADRIRDGAAIILEDSLERPKTKSLFGFFKGLELDKRRVLVIGLDGQFEDNLKRSIRNIPKKHFVAASMMNGYQLDICKHIVITSGAMDKLKEEVLV